MKKVLEFDKINMPLSFDNGRVKTARESNKRTKVISGHAMSVRDDKKGTSEAHKLFSNGKLNYLSDFN